MVTLFYSTRKENDKFYNHLDSKCNESTEIVEFVNDGTHSLAQAYNIAIQQCTTPYLILTHDDVILPDGFDQTIIDTFKKYPDFGIIGVAGSPFLPQSGVWFEKRHLMCGRVSHQQTVQSKQKKKTPSKKKWESKYSALFPAKLMECVVVDGVFIALNLTNIKAPFQENIEGYHYYDVAFCFENFQKGVKIGVTSDIHLTHKSIGKLNPEWYIAAEEFKSLYKEQLPISISSTPVFIKNTPTLENEHEVAIIIPSKNNYGYLSKCITSIYKKTKYTNFKIYVADTGSDEETLSQIESLIDEHDNIILLKYDFYNFAKINNIVADQLPDSTELILFCNDDIEFINDCITEMVATITNNDNIGTVGARLYYGNGLVQHGGITAFFRDNRIGVTHRGIQTFYGAGWDEEKVLGNTGALMMVKRNDFKRFDENTTECFEDLLLNMQFIIDGKSNIYNGNAVAYHHESITRKKDEGTLKRQTDDYNKLVLPFIEANIKKLKRFIIGI